MHTFDQALALACAGEHRRAVLLEVTVLGAYIRFERGMRYERQRVRVARVGACACGRMPCAFADAGWGRTGWRVLTAVCAECAARRGRTAFASWTAVSFAEFVRCGGGPLRIVAGGEPGEPEGKEEAVSEVRSVPELAAEASLMQARLDWLQRELARFTGGGRVS
ncbi:hypothetical protein AB0F64_25485 [Streptomyces sp. NPDC026294]|uniref:hypothetical protein n=1 Tax=Streptomyces sp. NPDC026294 TaxID=3155362 RepID=UPI0033EC0F24